MSAITKLYSVNQSAGTAALRTKFEPHVHFTSKKGYLMYNNTLTNILAKNVDVDELAETYHVGFLDDNTDAAQAYAVPNAAFRAWLRGLATAVDTLQKMIDTTGTLDASNQMLDGDPADFGLHYFRNIDMLDLSRNGLTNPLPVEFTNCTNIAIIDLYDNSMGLQAVNDTLIVVHGMAVFGNVHGGSIDMRGTNMTQPDGTGLTAAQSLVNDFNWTVKLKDGTLGRIENWELWDTNWNAESRLWNA